MIFLYFFGSMRDRLKTIIFEKTLHGGLPHNRNGFSSSLHNLRRRKSASSSKFHGVPSGFRVPRSIENPGLIPTVIAWAATRGGE